MSVVSFFVAFILLTVSFQAWIMRCQQLACSSTDMKALVGFSNCLGSLIAGWNGSADCCTWTGVMCDNSTVLSKRIVGLELVNQKLTGTICESLSGLDQLRILNLSHNQLRGRLPAKLFRLENLEVLDLSNNYLEGSIPEGVDFPSIQYIDISINNFNGSFDTTLCESSPHIKILNLAYNHFSGELFTSLGRCTSLQHLFLNGNNLSGSLNGGLFNLSSLIELDISSNSFSGFLPDDFRRLGNLEMFHASSNNFTGHLPMSLVNSASLLELDLHNNSLNGPININCSVTAHLTSLHLGINAFQGPIPDSISSCHNLVSLNLGHNNLGRQNQVPYNFRNLLALTFLGLSKSGLANITEALGILGNCKNLTSLIISENFHGEQMPSDVNLHFRNLRTVSMAYCELRGSIPMWLSGSSKLQFLDLSWNKLSGTIPFWFHDFKYLFYIDLSNNSFTGEIPRSFAELQGLINQNSSLEEPPVGFPLFRTGRDDATFRYKGIWSFPPTMDLSYNKFSGSISPYFGNLKELHVLNLMENHLSGIIPDSLSGMIALESLDLSHNELSGKIPPALEKPSFLSKFSVPFNQLQGEIPKGGQFMTFPLSSFEGNKGLCGGDLNPCPPTQKTTHIEPGNEEIDIVGLQFGLGAVTGFLLAVTFCFTAVGRIQIHNKQLSRTSITLKNQL